MKLCALLASVGAAVALPRQLQEGPVTPNNVRSALSLSPSATWFEPALRQRASRSVPGLRSSRCRGSLGLSDSHILTAALLRSCTQGPGVWGTPGGPTFDCAMRKLAYTFGKQLRPDQGAFSTLHEALDLNGFEGNCSTEAVAPTAEQVAAAKTFLPHEDLTVPAAGAIFVAPSGDDTADGSLAAPLQSIQLACDRAAAHATINTVVLRDGTHYIADTIYLTEKHSGLTIQSHEGERAVVSGGTELKVTWKKSTEGKGNMYVANIKGQVEDVPGLQIDGKRATRARYPNLPGGLEASCGYGCMIPSSEVRKAKSETIF